MGDEGSPQNLPSNVVVKNTFIDLVDSNRPDSMDGFFEERMVRSCPATRMGSSSDAEMREQALALAMQKHLILQNAAADAVSAAAAAAAAADTVDVDTEATVASGSGAASATAQRVSFDAVTAATATSGFAAPTESSAPGWTADWGTEATMGTLSDDCDWNEAQPQLSSGDERLISLGSPALPTLGSLGHDNGNCKPCAFFHVKGCGSGSQCQFCHLCESGEKKRRQKEKIERRRQERAERLFLRAQRVREI